MKSKLSRIGLGIALLATIVSPLSAGDGRIPIWEPTVITSSGNYYLTRDLTSSSGTGPTILVAIGTERVEIDLNGFSIHADPALSSQAAIQAEDVTDLTIRHGVIFGGGTGPEAGIWANRVGRVLIERVVMRDFAGPGIIVEETRVATVRNNAVLDSQDEAIQFKGGAGGRITGEVTGNVVKDSRWGLWIQTASSVGIRDNRIGGSTDFGIVVEDCVGCLVVDNAVNRASFDGIRLDRSEACELRGNSVVNAGTYGLSVMTSDSNLIVDNTVKRSAEDGLRVDGLENHIERNLLIFNGQSGSGWGLHLLAGASSNTFGRNTARTHPGPAASCASTPPPTKPATDDFCDEGVNNSSFGDNFMPFLF